MKFYNPFKPHIVQANNERFYIRKYMLEYGFVYKYNHCDEWVPITCDMIFDGRYTSYEKAKIALLNYNENLKKKFKVVKVLNDT